MYLMLDFETLGTSSDTALLSLGAVAFNKSNIFGEQLWEFDLVEQLELGRSVSGATLRWWMKQDALARKVFEDNDFKVKLGPFFDLFEKWLASCLEKAGEKYDELKPMSNGANFDITIMDELYKRHHPNRESAIPWKFWNARCFRTFKDLTKCCDLVRRKQTQGVKHNALDDAKYQAECVRAVWNRKK